MIHKHFYPAIDMTEVQIQKHMVSKHGMAEGLADAHSRTELIELHEEDHEPRGMTFSESHFHAAPTADPESRHSNALSYGKSWDQMGLEEKRVHIAYLHGFSGYFAGPLCEVPEDQAWPPVDAHDEEHLDSLHAEDHSEYLKEGGGGPGKHRHVITREYTVKIAMQAMDFLPADVEMQRIVENQMRPRFDEDTDLECLGVFVDRFGPGGIKLGEEEGDK